ncbi:hypothetical protein IWW56_001614 [Coemansia sp. RSA 2131]|nr:hypothetical protein IWW56_001614 [Coemansia sp. RSA 2131]
MLFKVAILAALISSVAGHMAMSEPCPRFSPNCANKPPLPAGVSDYDYSIKSPVPYDGPLMKSDIPWPESATTWTAGQPATVKFQPGGAAHGGGHCQFSISYDNGKTAAVVHEVLQHCFFSGASGGNGADIFEYTFPLPATMPSSDNALLIWTWVNAVGNREFYANSATLKIVGGTGNSYTGKQMTIANHAGYETIPEFSGNYATGLQLYTNAPNITITASGSSGSGYTGEQVASASTNNAQPSSPAAPTSSAPAYDSATMAAPTASATLAAAVPAYHARIAPIPAPPTKCA